MARTARMRPQPRVINVRVAELLVPREGRSQNSDDGPNAHRAPLAYFQVSLGPTPCPPSTFRLAVLRTIGFASPEVDSARIATAMPHVVAVPAADVAATTMR